MSGKIFISYRHDDKSDTRWLADKLIDHFGNESVFYDQNTIEPGQMFPDELRKAVAEAPVVLIIVGRYWEKILRERTAEGASLSDDWVVREIKIALDRLQQNEARIFVVTMYRDGMPEGPFEGLPESLNALCNIHMHAFTGNDHSQWTRQLEKLVELISESPNAPQGCTRTVRGDMPPARLQGCLPPAREERSNRKDLIEKAVRLLSDGQPASLALWGLPGIGKSMLAAQLFKNSEIRKLFPDGQYWINLGMDADSRLVLIQLRKLAKCLGIADEAMSQISEEGLQSSLQEYVGEQKMLFVFDDVWSDEVGEQVRIEGSNCACVFTARQEGTAMLLAESERYTLMVPKLDQSESAQLVKSIAPDAFATGQKVDVTNAIAACIAKYDGLPLVLSILAKRLKKAGANSKRILRELEKFSAGDVYILFEASCKDLDHKTLDALKQLSALRPDPDSFSLELFEQATGGTEDMAEELKDAGLIYKLDARQPAGREGDEDDPDGHYGIHRTIAEWLYASLDPAEAKRVWARAASHFAERLNDIEESNSGSDYDRWYRHESLVWQQTMYDLRYYLLKAGDYDKAAFILTKAWIGGFWWWGCFDQFEFCDQLVENWPADLDKEGSELVRDLNDLETIKEFYPKETEGNRFEKTDSWEKVRESLHGLLTRRGLEKDTRTLDNDQCDLRGLLCIFLAETYRFGERDYTKAAEFYKDAVAMFSRQFDEDVECWNLTWAQFHLADCLYENKQKNEADAISLEAILTEQKKADGDQEVLARLHKLRGDIEASNGNLLAAIGQYHNAVYYAYRFQVFKDLETPSEPDIYTLKYYPEMASRVIASLIGSYEEDKNHAHLLAVGLGKCWHDQLDANNVKQLLIDGNAERLFEVLFDPFLPDGQLSDAEEKAKYADVVRKRLQYLRPSVFNDSGEVQVQNLT